jgi:hypothetical protein
LLGDINVTRILIIALTGALTLTWPAAAFAQDASSTQPPAQAAAEDDDPDRDVNLAQPDFNLVALPTTLRVPRHRGSFRITHRFGRPLGAGSFGELVEDLFGLDSGAVIGLEFRYGLLSGTQVGIHRTSGSKTIQFMAQHNLLRQSDTMPLGFDVLAAIEGRDNFKDNYAPTVGVLLSREFGDAGAIYVEPMFVNNSNPFPEELVDDNSTVMVGIGLRARIRPTVYLVLEGTPRVAGYDPGDTQISFGIEKRAGGHLFQLNFSNGHGTTFGQLANGGFEGSDWFLGFNISRKFF